jgi:hypothetical protein
MMLHVLSFARVHQGGRSLRHVQEAKLKAIIEALQALISITFIVDHLLFLVGRGRKQLTS